MTSPAALSTVYFAEQSIWLCRLTGSQALAALEFEDACMFVSFFMGDLVGLVGLHVVMASAFSAAARLREPIILGL